jgi:hypothetical protein
LRFHCGNQFFGRGKTSEVVRNRQHIGVVFGDRRAGFIRRSAARAIGER